MLLETMKLMSVNELFANGWTAERFIEICKKNRCFVMLKNSCSPIGVVYSTENEPVDEFIVGDVFIYDRYQEKFTGAKISVIEWAFGECNGNEYVDIIVEIVADES